MSIAQAVRQEPLPTWKAPPNRMDLWPSPLGDVISAVGGDRFHEKLVSWLYRIVGVEHLAIFAFNGDVPVEVRAVSVDGTDTAHRQVLRYISGGYWRRDPSIAEACSRMASPIPNMIRVDVASLLDHDLQYEIWGKTKIKERILLCGGTSNNPFVLSILRPEHRGALSDEEASELNGAASTVLALIAKHTEINDWNHKLAHALTSIDEIQARIATAPDKFPRREREVCARIIYGLSTVGISLDLGIGEETVMTYRKRLYQRLGIATQRELLIWYLRLWSASSVVIS